MRFIPLMLAACALLSASCAARQPPPISALLAGRDGVEPGLDGLGALDMPMRLPPPDGSSEAQSYLSGALAALRAGQPQHAALFLDAILGSDHLSDRGRANIYWLAADAHRMAGHDDAYVNALGGFLVASDLVMPDDDFGRRQQEARTALLAHKARRDPLVASAAAR